MRIRLLNPSIYTGELGKYNSDPMHRESNYPVIVEASEKDHNGFEFTGRMHVSYKELDRVFPYGFERDKYEPGKGIGWWNHPVKRDAKTPQISWEPVTPFDYWNKLKSSRAVGDVVPVGYLLES